MRIPRCTDFRHDTRRNEINILIEHLSKTETPSLMSGKSNWKMISDEVFLNEKILFHPQSILCQNENILYEPNRIHCSFTVDSITHCWRKMMLKMSCSICLSMFLTCEFVKTNKCCHSKIRCVIVACTNSGQLNSKRQNTTINEISKV